MSYAEQEAALNRRRAAAEDELRAGTGDLRDDENHPRRSAAWMRAKGWMDELHEYAIEHAHETR